MKKLVFISCLFTSLCAIGSTRIGEHLFLVGATTPFAKAFQLELNTGFFKSTSRFDATGNSTELSTTESFLKADIDLVLRYGFRNNLEFRAGGRLRHNVTKNGSGSSTVSATGAESVNFGLKWAAIKWRKWLLALDVNVMRTAYSNEEYADVGAIPNDKLVLGDDGLGSEVGAHISYLRRSWHAISFYGGFRTPPNSLSQEIPYSASLFMKGKKWGLELGIEGIFSLEKDRLENRPIEATRGTSLFNSVNRQWNSAYGGLYRAFDRWRLGLTVSQRLSGKNTDGGSEVAINLLRASKGITKRAKKISKFKEYAVEARITKVSPREIFIRIDAGLSSDVSKGMKFDIYKKDNSGNDRLVAAGVAYEVGSATAIVRVVRRYRGTALKEGFVVRGY